jgi:hypothetical protein
MAEPGVDDVLSERPDEKAQGESSSCFDHSPDSSVPGGTVKPRRADRSAISSGQSSNTRTDTEIAGVIFARFLLYYGENGT